jgi:hypothetical protein
MYASCMMKHASFSELIGDWPRDDGQTSIGTFARDIGVAYYHAQTMRYRRSISVEFWPRVISAAQKRGIKITHEDLVEMRGHRRRALRNRGAVAAVA